MKHCLKKSYTVIFLFLIIPLTALAKNNCDSATSTTDIRACLSKEYKVADKHLNKKYRLLYSMLPDKGKQLLKKAQNSWLTFRKNECEFTAYRYHGGTLSLVISDTCYVDLTKARTKVLADHIDLYKNN